MISIFSFMIVPPMHVAKGVSVLWALTFCKESTTLDLAELSVRYFDLALCVMLRTALTQSGAIDNFPS
jgi:hypothetical protein